LTQEARAASALNHPNIVTVYEVIRDGDTPLIVMEMVKGEPLGSARETPQPLEQVVQLVLQTAKALAAAHAHGIIHCDIKPENILVRSDGYVKVLDFGVARQIGRDAATARISGTPRYMSPEQSHPFQEYLDLVNSPREHSSATRGSDRQSSAGHPDPLLAT